MDLRALLLDTSIFRGLSEADAASVRAAGRVLVFGAGDTIFEQGSLEKDLYVLVLGAVDIVFAPTGSQPLGEGSARPRVLSRVHPGESFGEMALIQGLARSASAVAAADGTQVFALAPERFEQLCRDAPAVGQSVFRHLSAGMAHMVREQNTALIDALMRDYFVHVLAEELAGELSYCDPTTPIEKTVTIRDPASFVLAGLRGEKKAETGAAPEKETFRLAVFSYLADLAVFGQGDPSGFSVLEHVFSLIREGCPPKGLTSTAFSFRLAAEGDRRSGVLSCAKRRGDRDTAYFVRWEVKGVGNEEGPTVCLYISADDEKADHQHLTSIVRNIDMPIQRFISQALPSDAGRGLRVLTVHHRTPEVAQTLQSLVRHGFMVEGYVGIPYGEASWLTARMLDHASGGNYFCLATREHPVRPTEHLFDFAHSSFQDAVAEDELRAMFEGSRATCGYLEAMTRLCALRLAKALKTCEREGSRLLIYEDGAYLIPIVYAAYLDAQNPLHDAVKRAVDSGMLVGAVEVTTAGERRNRAVIEQNAGQALLPVLSCALEDIKLIYEGLGVAEAVLGAASTAFGNLGLPTFAARRPAVLGGNGAIGTRLVEQLVLAHNSTANVFVVDVADNPFRRTMDKARYPHAATRLQYKRIRRFFVGPKCLPIAIDRPFAGAPFSLEPKGARAALERFFGEHSYDEAVLTNVALDRDEWVVEVATAAGYVASEEESLPDGSTKIRWFERASLRKKVTLLDGSVVFAFRTLAPLIHAGIDTVIGSTGFEAFREADLDAFLDRKTGSDETQGDLLSLLSASSKDYEFKRATVLLGRLLTLQHGAATVDEALLWLSEFYREKRSFVAGDEAAEAEALLLVSADPLTLAARVEEQSGKLAAALANVPVGGLRAALATHLTECLRGVLTLRKEVRPDVGLVYHMTYRGRPKTLVLLANGLVVNFFARYEKGVKTEYIDSIVTMQMLGLLRFAAGPVPKGLHRIDKHLDAADMDRLWQALEARCSPLSFEGAQG